MSETTYDLSAIFDGHVGCEFVAKDVAATMATIPRRLPDAAVGGMPEFAPGTGCAGARVPDSDMDDLLDGGKHQRLWAPGYTQKWRGAGGG